MHISHAGEEVSQQEVVLSGEAIYDLQADQIRSLLMVGSGTLVWPEVPDQIVTFDSLAEWRLEEL